MQLEVTYTVTKTIKVECDGKGFDSYPKVPAEQITEEGIIDLVKTIETQNAEDVIIGEIENGTVDIQVDVKKIN